MRHGTYTGRSVSVEGALDPSALGAAFTALQRAYPVTTARIGEDAAGRGYLLRPGDVAPAGIWESHGDPDVVRVPAEPMNPATQLAYLDLVLGGAARSRVTLFVHHSIADAGHGVELFSRLWDYYTDHVDTGTITVVPHDYPQSLEWYAAARGIVRDSVSGFEDMMRPLPSEAKTLPCDNGAVATSALARPRRTRLDQKATARIIRLSRHQGITVNALVTAALLRAYAAEFPGAAGDPVPVGCLYPVDMRSRLSPSIAAAAGTNMAGLAAFTADIDVSSGVAELAQRISARLRHDLAGGIVQQSVLHFPDFFGTTRTHSLASHVAVTNPGMIPDFRTPAHLGLTDYEIVYLSAHPRPSAGASAAVTFLMYTFAGRLTIGLLGGGTDADRLLMAARKEPIALSAASTGAYSRSAMASAGTAGW
ncbi:acyltransferase PapA5 [Candidatus Protofrankia datiscae]|uniref:Phthiocerol/phthiodiolone dimycocerosyl transferase n=1 Tax=Candidatus Protofrankia datiscae TaxID=2716812 RepID=F8AZT0_9ACTN|nr:acyltransferase PapA5 [Candidatus Protofrankia datiscae]